MDYIISFLFFLLCLWLLYRMANARDVIDFQMGVIGAFSVGYYCLPIWFKHMSPLGALDENSVTQAILIFFLFGIFVTLGTWIGRKIVPYSVSFQTESLDRILVPNRKTLSYCAFLFYIYYYSTQNLTSYSADNFEAFFAQKGPLDAVISMIADLSIGWISLCFALAIRNKERQNTFIYAAMIGTCLFLLLFVGQRLALLSPIVMLMAALAITGQPQKSVRLLVIGVVVLLLISPIAVFLRESRHEESFTAQNAIKSFDYGDDMFTTIFQSIIDRGDLIYVSARMKSAIDADPLPGGVYYASVLFNAIPRAIFPGGVKPYPLSTNGLPTGELSVYSWRFLHSNTTGSLSAFGGIVAYRELGWAGVFLNGILTGVFFVFVSRWLSRGGFLAMVYYSSIFVNLSIRKVPPSFWEAILSVMPLLPFLMMIYLIDRGISYLGRQGTRNAGRPSNPAHM